MKNSKKIFTICASLFVSASLSVSAFASSLALTSPVTDATIYYGEDVQLEFDAPEGDTVTVLIDGKEVAEVVSEGSNSVTIDEELAFGSHTVELVSDGAEGSSYVTDKFNMADKEDVLVKSNNFNDGTASGVTISGSGTIGTNADETVAEMELKKDFVGPEGEGDVAFGFYMANSYEVRSASNSFGQYFLYQKLTPDYWRNGTALIEYDLKMFGYGKFGIETQNENNKWGYFGGSSSMLTPEGKIGTTDATYPLDTWMHFKHVIDYDNMVETVYLDDEPVLTFVLAEKNVGVKQIKPQYYVVSEEDGTSEGNKGFAIDNILLQGQSIIKGMSTLEYDVNGNYTVAENNVVTEASNKIKLTTSTVQILSESEGIVVNADYEGTKLTVKSATVDAEGALIIEFANSLPTQGKINLDIALPVRNAAGEVADTVDYFYSFSTDIEPVTIGSVTITNSESSKPYYIKKQLDEVKVTGATLLADVTLKNPTSQDSDLTLIGVVYDGNQFVSITAVPVNALAEPDTLELVLPAGIEEPSIEIYLIDDFADRNAFAKVWTLK